MAFSLQTADLNTRQDPTDTKYGWEFVWCVIWGKAIVKMGSETTNNTQEKKTTSAGTAPEHNM